MKSRNVVLHDAVSASGQPDKIIIYNYVLNKWSVTGVEIRLARANVLVWLSVDGLDNLSSTVDGLDIQLDSRFFKGGAVFLRRRIRRQNLCVHRRASCRGTIETQLRRRYRPASTRHSRLGAYCMGRQRDCVGRHARHAVANARRSHTQRRRRLTTRAFAGQGAGTISQSAHEVSGGWDKALGIDIEAREIGRR